jgi:tRNA-dihydrouridine synthase 1
MLNSNLFVRSARYRRDFMTTCTADRPLVIQFCANDPETLVQAAKYVEGICDAIDLNLGCPQGIAKRGHYGCYLQDEWDLIHSLINAVHTRVAVPVWAKIRVFADDEKTVQYAQMVERAGAQLIGVHGRTRENKGRVQTLADWTIIRKVKQAVKVPVYANGNIRHMDDVRACLEETGADGVMSAESLLANPALFSAKDIPSADLATEYIEFAERYDAAPGMVRGHLFKILGKDLEVHTDIRDKLARAKSLEQMKSAASELCTRLKNGDPPPAAASSCAQSAALPTQPVETRNGLRQCRECSHWTYVGSGICNTSSCPLNTEHAEIADDAPPAKRQKAENDS